MGVHVKNTKQDFITKRRLKPQVYEEENTLFKNKNTFLKCWLKSNKLKQYVNKD